MHLCIVKVLVENEKKIAESWGENLIPSFQFFE
jgi:hypothetical protein